VVVEVTVVEVVECEVVVEEWWLKWLRWLRWLRWLWSWLRWLRWWFR